VGNLLAGAPKEGNHSHTLAANFVEYMVLVLSLITGAPRARHPIPRRRGLEGAPAGLCWWAACLATEVVCMALKEQEGKPLYYAYCYISWLRKWKRREVNHIK